MDPLILREQITVFSQTKQLKTIRDFVSRVVGNSPLPAQDRNKIIIAIDEAVANIIQHGYEDREDGVIDVIIEATARKFIARIRDSGVTFNPANVSDIDIEEHVKAGKKRGLGIFLIRKIMDEVNYTFKEGVQNELLMVKYIKNK